MKKILLICNEENAGKRLDKFITDEFDSKDEFKNIFSRNKIQELIKNSFIKLNNIIYDCINYKVKKNDSIEILMNEDNEFKLKEKSDIILDILYEDKDLMVINKQAGLSVHPGAGNYENTLVNALLYHCKDNLSNISGDFRPGIVHRLDKDTTGVMIVAKNNESHLILQDQLNKRILKRVYNAIIWGNIVPENGQIEGYIRRCEKNRLKMRVTQDIGKYSLTNYQTLEKFGNTASLLRCELTTGRTHQIRVHFSSKQHPLIGDQLYGGNSRKVAGGENECKSYIDSFLRQALHSKTLRFIHPRTNEEMYFETELPRDLEMLIKCLRMCKVENN